MLLDAVSDFAVAVRGEPGAYVHLVALEAVFAVLEVVVEADARERAHHLAPHVLFALEQRDARRLEHAAIVCRGEQRVQKRAFALPTTMASQPASAYMKIGAGEIDALIRMALAVIRTYLQGTPCNVKSYMRLLR